MVQQECCDSHERNAWNGEEIRSLFGYQLEFPETVRRPSEVDNRLQDLSPAQERQDDRNTRPYVMKGHNDRTEAETEERRSKDTCLPFALHPLKERYPSTWSYYVRDPDHGEID